MFMNWKLQVIHVLILSPISWLKGPLTKVKLLQWCGLSQCYLSLYSTTSYCDKPFAFSILTNGDDNHDISVILNFHSPSLFPGTLCYFQVNCFVALDICKCIQTSCVSLCVLKVLVLPLSKQSRIRVIHAIQVELKPYVQ